MKDFNFVSMRLWAKQKDEAIVLFKQMGHNLIDEEAYKDFDEMVDNNASSWRGIEYLDSVLTYVRTMKDESISVEVRLREAYDQFQSEDHSGATAHMTLGAIKRFCKNGDRLASAIESFKFERVGF